MRLDGVEIVKLRLRCRKTEFLPRSHMQDLAAEAFVAQQPVDVVEADEAPDAVLLPEEDLELLPLLIDPEERLLLPLL